MLKQLHIQLFQTFILDWYSKYGRKDLPWRTHINPYRTLVSEIMLQQTQVQRVIPKFESFLQKFPTYQALASASTQQIIMQWQGLGYNRRGLFLQKTAQSILKNHKGNMPQSKEELLTLPGIGPYTASAIMAFAFNKPVVVIETNIRAIYIYHFFNTKKHTNQVISDSQLVPLIEQTLYSQNPHLWYSALMDYGSFLKTKIPNPNKKSKTYTIQSRFQGSFRQLRGYILRELSAHTEQNTPRSLSFAQLAKGAPRHFNKKEVQLALNKLENEGFISKSKAYFSLNRA